MALFEVESIDPSEQDQMKKYAEFVSCISTGRYLVTVRCIHHEPHCPHHPLPMAGRRAGPENFRKCCVMPNGVHAHLYTFDRKEHVLRFIEVSDAENEALFDASY